jgi:hypothetical protein
MAHVGQRLLDGPVGGERLPFGKLARHTGDVQVYGQARVAERIQEALQPVQAGLRAAVGRVIAGAQNAEQAAHLGQSASSRRGDRLQSRDGRPRVTLRGVPTPIGLHHDDRKVVRYDVVHLAGDTSAFLGCGDLRTLVPFALGLAGPLNEFGDVGLT